MKAALPFPKPPISTSSPLETQTTFFDAKVLRQSKTAAALLFTTVAASAPVSSVRIFSTWLSLSPLDPFSSSYSKLSKFILNSRLSDNKDNQLLLQTEEAVILK